MGRPFELPPTHKYAKGWAEYVADAKIRFHWNGCDHTQVVDYAKKPRHKRMGPEGARMMASWWSKAKGGCTVGVCKRCTRAA